MLSLLHRSRFGTPSYDDSGAAFWVKILKNIILEEGTLSFRRFWSACMRGVGQLRYWSGSRKWSVQEPPL